MTLFTIDLPANRSRTSTQAVTVPKTAFTSAARIATITLSFSAATASGFEIAPRKPDQPSSPEAATTAASGRTTISVRYAVTKPRERAVPALSLCQLRLRGAADVGATPARGRAADAALDPDHDPVRAEPLLVDRAPAAEDRVVDPEDAGPCRILRRVLLGDCRVDRAPAVLPEQILGDGALREADERVCQVLVRARLQDCDRELDQHRLARDDVLDVRAGCPRRERLALVGQEDVALTGQERVRRVPARGVLGDHVLEEVLHERPRLLVGLAEAALGAVGRENVPLRGARAERVRSHHLDTGLDEIRPALDVLR